MVQIENKQGEAESEARGIYIIDEVSGLGHPKTVKMSFELAYPRLVQIRKVKDFSLLDKAL